MTKITYLDSPMTYRMFCFQFAKINKFKLLGHGQYASVYSNKKSPYAYKIGLITNEQKDPYLTYLKKIQKENNPFFPKIRTITIFKFKSEYYKEKFYVVEMEKLEVFNHKKSPLALIKLHRFMDKHVHNKIVGELSEAKKPKIILKIDGIQPVFDLLQKLGERFNPDWHAANMMMRKDGQLVFTDPIY